jgi:hypothetical protein
MMLRSDRSYGFDLTPDELWSRVGQLVEYTEWWPWLAHFDGVMLETGQRWKCTVQPPLPYAVRFTVAIGRIIPARSVAATITGDVVGTAALTIEPTSRGCQARIVAELGPEKQALRTLSVAARPIVRFGHNWVLDSAARQFRERAVPADRPQSG